MNDPNGLIQWQGQVHLFYQYNPNGALWGNMHWGHAVSPDFIHWTDLPIALAPTPGGPDEAGVYSGCAVDNGGTPTIIYTATRGAHNEIQTQALATSSDNLLTWQKHPKNPVISVVPAESGQTRDFRDPFVWKEDDGWYLALASQIKGVGGVVFLYRSANLVDWEYLNPLFVGDIKRNGFGWECPNFFKLGDWWVLVVSAMIERAEPRVIYFVGTYANHRFVPEYEGTLDYEVLYAPLSFEDAQQRRIMFGWLRESRPDRDQVHAGWSGVQSVPRVLSLDNQKRLVSTPAPELDRLRGARHQCGPLDLSAPDTVDVAGLTLDISAEFAARPGGLCGLSVACSPDGKERTDISYDPATSELSICHTVSPIGDGRHERVVIAPHILADTEALSLRVLLDGSVIELIANGRTSISSRVYPTHDYHNQVQLFGTATHLNSLDIWEMQSIWP